MKSGPPHGGEVTNSSAFIVRPKTKKSPTTNWIYPPRRITRRYAWPELSCQGRCPSRLIIVSSAYSSKFGISSRTWSVIITRFADHHQLYYVPAGIAKRINPDVERAAIGNVPVYHLGINRIKAFCGSNATKNKKSDFVTVTSWNFRISYLCPSSHHPRISRKGCSSSSITFGRSSHRLFVLRCRSVRHPFVHFRFHLTRVLQSVS